MEDLSRQLGELHGEMRGGFKELRSEIKDVRSEIQDVRSETTVEFRAMRAEIAALNRTVLAGMFGGFSSIVAALIAFGL